MVGNLLERAYKKIEKYEGDLVMETILTIASVGGTVLAAGLTFVITFLKTMGKTRAARAEAEEAKSNAIDEAAKNAINAEIERLIQIDESAYSELDALLKKQVSGTAGSIKFRDVLLSLHDFCLDNGYAWNEEAMTEAINSKVSFTKSVNAN